MTTRPPDGRLRGWRSRLVWLLLALDLAFAFGVWVAAGPGPGTPAFAPLLFAAMVASLGGVGALVATRRPRDPVGWILLVSASMVTLSLAGQAYVRLSETGFAATLPLTVAVAWLYGLIFMPAVILIAGVMPLYFPDGRLPSRRWRWVVWMAAFGIVVVILPTAFAPGPLANSSIPNPLGIPGFGPFYALLALSNLVVSLVVLPMAIASPIVKYRRGSRAMRAQLKWFAIVALFTVASFTMAVVGISPLGDLGWLLGLLGLVFLPVAIGIAILRYRLYEIDRIVSRTISYTVVTALLVGVFAGAVLVFQTILAPLTGQDTIAVAASTLVVAALFQPLRVRVQRVVDRRFNRARYDAERTATAFAARLRDQVGLDEIERDVLGTVEAAVRPRGAALWISVADRESPR